MTASPFIPRIIFGEVEFDFWKKGQVREARKQNLELFQKIAVPLSEKATFLKPDGEVVSGISGGHPQVGKVPCLGDLPAENHDGRVRSTRDNSKSSAMLTRRAPLSMLAIWASSQPHKAG